MDAVTARQLVAMVNDPNFYADLKMYAEHRIKTLHRDLETAELVRVDKIQGQIVELKRLLTLQDEVHEKAK